MIRIRTVLILCILISQTACNDFNKFYTQNKTRHTTGSNQYIARVGNRYITTDDLKHALNEIPLKQRILIQSSEAGFNNFLQTYINKELLYIKALELGLDKRDDVKLKSESYFKKLLINSLTQVLLNNKINEDDVEKYYKSNADKFMTAKVTVISLYKNNMIEDEELEVIANDLRMKLISGSAMNSIKEFLDKRSGLRYKIKESIDIPMNYYDTAVTEIIYNIKPNEISYPVNLKNSYNIYKLEQEPEAISYVNVKDQIKNEMRTIMYRNYLSELEKSQGVEIYVSNYKEIQKND